MKNGLIIFNGIQFHYYHINRAIDWAAKNNTGLRALFVHSLKEPPEGYIFPSDIDPAENLYDKKDAAKENVDVIHSQVKLLADMAKEKAVAVQTEELVDVPLKKILEITGNSAILFLDAAYKDSFILANNSFTLKELFKESKCPVEMVSDNP